MGTQYRPTSVDRMDRTKTTRSAHPVRWLRTRHLLYIPLVVIASFGACDDQRSGHIDSGPHAIAEGEPGAIPEDPGAGFGTEPTPTRPIELYYDLTAFDWYRRGEPLILGGHEYRPAGIPESERARSFEPAGRYGGVVYYVLEDSSPPHQTVYVPVAPGYWLPFATDAIAHGREAP